MKVIKRDGRKVDYDRDRIIIAISRANRDVSGKDKISRSSIECITSYIEGLNRSSISIEEIQDIIEEKLMEFGKYALAKKYILYREKHALIRQYRSTDENVLSLVKNPDKVIVEANNNTYIASNQRDLIAGEVSNDLTDRLLLPERIVKAQNEGAIHFHNKDHFIQPINNCCIVNIGDMLDNGTVINGKMIESPKSFEVACLVTTQIIANVASNQYGGQSIDIRHLGKYLKKTYDKTFKKYNEEGFSEEEARKIADLRKKEDLKAGIQIMQYQLNTLMTTNGQTPFVTLFMYVDSNNEYVEEIALIIEEILNQRLQGIKNDLGELITPAFPKLVYVLDENNCLKGGKYDYLTRLAIKCSSKTIYPDYISAKQMRKNYEGNVFSPMGCRNFLMPWKDKNGNYKFEGRFNQGVVSLNLPQIGILAYGDEDKFWKLFDKRLELCKDALICRHNALLGTKSDVSPIHWQYGAIARLKKGEKIDELLYGGYSSISLGYIGLYELTKLMKGVPQTEPEGFKFALEVMNYMKAKTIKWKEETNIGFDLYGTPSDSLCHKFAKIDKERFGEIKDITDKGYYTNSYHIDERQRVNVLDKLLIESKFQSISNGGSISYIEISNSVDDIEKLIGFVYDNVQYVEFNSKPESNSIYEGDNKGKTKEKNLNKVII